MFALFPETPAIKFTVNHFRFIDVLLLHSEGVLQKKVVKSLNIDKTTVHEIKTDVMMLGWCKETYLGSAKELNLKISRVKEVKNFVRGWLSARRTIPVRPHSILIKGSFIAKQEKVLYALEKLSQTYPVNIYVMKNNRKYRFKTEYGSINIMAKGSSITYWIDGFVLPIAKGDVQFLEDYIEEGIFERFNALHSIVKEHFKLQRITVLDVVVLKKLQVGLLTKKNLAAFLDISASLRSGGLFKDASVEGLDEWEADGSYDIVINRIKSALVLFFEKQTEYDCDKDGIKPENNAKSEVENNGVQNL